MFPLTSSQKYPIKRPLALEARMIKSKTRVAYYGTECGTNRFVCINSHTITLFFLFTDKKTKAYRISVIF